MKTNAFSQITSHLTYLGLVFDLSNPAAGQAGANRPGVEADGEELLESIMETTLFCGEGLQPWAELVKERLGHLAVVVNEPAPASRLWSLVKVARRRLATGESDDLATLQPYYLRMPSIGAPKQRDRVEQDRRQRPGHREPRARL